MKSIHSTMLSNAYRRKKWAWHLGVALHDFANVRKFSGSTPAHATHHRMTAGISVLENTKACIGCCLLFSRVFSREGGIGKSS